MAAAAAACTLATAASHRRCCRRQVVAAAASGSGPLDCSARLAAVRAVEQQQTLPLFADSYAAAALDAAAAAGGALPAALDAPDLQRDALATRFLDEQLLKAATIVNLERDLTQAGGGARVGGTVMGAALAFADQPRVAPRLVF